MAVHVSYNDLSILSAFFDVRGREYVEVYRAVDPNDATDVKAAIQRFIVPHVRAMSGKVPGYKDRLKESLRYYLNKGVFPFEAVYEAQEPAFELPDDPLNYYRWAWEVLFPGKKYELDSLEGYVEDTND